MVDGSSLYVGAIEATEVDGSRWRIEKRSLSSGALDMGFDHDGWFTTDMSNEADNVTAMASDGTSLYLCGYYGPAWGDLRWHLEKRSLSDGHVDLFFKWDDSGTPVAGWVNENPSPGGDFALAIAYDSDYLYIAGTDNAPGGDDDEWRIEKRSAETGSPVAAFGSAGAAISNPSSKPDGACSIAVDYGALYIGGYDGAGNGGRARIEKRRADTGALAPSFSGDGALELDWSSDDDRIVWLGAKDNAIYDVGFDSAPGSSDTEWRIEKRRESDGFPLWSLTSNPSVGLDKPADAVIDGDSIYVFGFETASGWIWRVEKRRLSDGSLVADFGEGGVARSSDPDLGDFAEAIAADADSIYVAGDDTSLGSSHGRYMIEKKRK